MSDNNVKKTRFDGLEVGSDGQVKLKSADVPDSELLPADPQSGGEHFNGGGELQAQFAKLQEENEKLTSDLESVSKTVESFVNDDLQGYGDGEVSTRLFAVLEGVLGGVKALQVERDGNREKAQQLEQERDNLQQQLKAYQDAEQERQAAAKEEQDRLAAEKEVEELKAKLDAAGVTYRANASKESLQKLVDDLPK